MGLIAQAAGADLATESGKRIVVSLVVTVVTATVTFLLGRYWGRYKASRAWRSQEFLDRVIVSLNVLSEGTLKIRTVLETGIEQVFLNPIAVEKVTDAAKRCTPEMPILPVPPEDRWYLLNYCLNAVAEHLTPGLLHYDAGCPVKTTIYYLFLTCEVVGPERIRKVRVMMVQKAHLDDFPYPDTLPNLENPWHETRVNTLRVAAALLKREPDHFLTLEAYTPVAESAR